MSYLKNNFSLQEMVLTQLAVQLCLHSPSLKKEIFCLLESAYGEFYNQRYTVKYKAQKKVWEEIIEQQSIQLFEKTSLPDLFKPKLVLCIHRIALQCLSWAKQQEMLFGISRQFSAGFLCASDWTVAGKLNERKLAERLVQCETINNYQRYQIACVYFLENFIPERWGQITAQQQKVFYDAEDPRQVKEPELVKLWSYYLVGKIDKLIRNQNYFWRYGLEQAIKTGAGVAARYCWKKISQNKKQKLSIEFTLQALSELISSKRRAWLQNLLSHSASYLAPPTQYNDILNFLLSQMSEEQQIIFFTKAFQSPEHVCVLEYFLDWPYQDSLLPTIKSLWDILPEANYNQLLLALVDKYTNRDELLVELIGQKENQNYDYGGLLLALLEQTPAHYKHQLFADKESRMFWDIKGDVRKTSNEGKALLLETLKKRPFNNKAIEIFQGILKAASVEEKKSIIYSKCGEEICACLIRMRNWELVEFVLAECLAEEEISDFKRKFILSDRGRSICFFGIKANHGEFVEAFFSWGLLSAEEIPEFRRNLIFGEHAKKNCCELILKKQLDCVDRIMRWFLSSAEEQRQFKVNLAKMEGMHIFHFFLRDGQWESLEQLLTWCFALEAEIKQFKKKLFSIIGIDIHLRLINASRWQDAEFFFKWCCLSSKEIKQFKKDTLFSGEELYIFADMLRWDEEAEQFLKDGGKWQSIALRVRWCLSDKETMLAFKKEIEAIYQARKTLNEKDKRALQNFARVINEQLSDLSSEQQTNKRGADVVEEEERVSCKRLAR